MNKLNDTQLSKKGDQFQKTMEFIRHTFGDRAFAKYRFSKTGFTLMSSFNAAVYDALSVAVADTVNIDNPNIPGNVAERYKNLFKDPTFFHSVEGSVNDQNKIETRIAAVKGILSE